ncbi:MAG: type I polyketide synthase, partial [bacterium]|nr:type I polyketide synthase [bacterium]
MAGIIEQNDRADVEIAVIGMAGRFPGADNIDEFWDNLKNGVESISFISEDQLMGAGLDARLLKNPNYVKSRGGVIEDKDHFDAHFFGYTPGEAEVMNPQMRIFHECAWEALENAGYAPGCFDAAVGVYAGASSSFHWEALTFLSGKRDNATHLAVHNIANKDFLTTRLAYKLDLKGPAITIQSACSTSLVAVHLACQGILDGECDMALAGGASISSADNNGYLYQEGMILSADGHCRAFDAGASGTIGGDGAGVVVLKLLEHAIEDRDYIYAVIKGSAINNDGINKASFTAPSREAQTETIKAALRMAEAEPRSISYIETHGTGTPIGDPIEMAALKQAFNTPEKQFCAVGSVKTNIGHLDAAAGIAGFIKAALALNYRLIPASLHYEKPNPKIDFENSPFYVNARLKEWKTNGERLRAGVSSLGIGGTNAHVIMEEVPAECRVRQGDAGAGQYKLLLLSAKTGTALDNASQNLTAFLKDNPGTNLADAAYTLQVSRKVFQHRRMVVCSTVNEAVESLPDPGSTRVRSFLSREENRPVVFMFSGQGSQYIDMGLQLYREEPVFRAQMDRCFNILNPLAGTDIKALLYPDAAADGSVKLTERLNRTEMTQPLIFAVEYSLATLLMKWGLSPYAMTGHSIGEYTAACLAGVFSLEDALELVVLRGKLMQGMPPGGMLSIPLSEARLVPMLNRRVALAVVNSSSHCVVSGEFDAIDAFAEALKENGFEGKPLHTSHAFHSAMMDPILEEFETSMAQVTLNKPGIPYISNVSGGWIKAEEAVSPGYWATHLRSTVRFSAG